MKYTVFVLSLAACLATGLAASVHKKEGEDQAIDLAEVCYDPYGCFPTSSPWTSLIRPISAFPKPPYQVGTRFLLYTHENPSENFELMPDNEFILKFSPYSDARRTVFIVHGFTDTEKAEWVIGARNGYLANEDVNVIVVDWGPGAKGTYHKCTANARLVGAQLARMLNFLHNKGNMDLDATRIVGHSLGAHVAGYAGQRLNGAIGQILALDTAEPYFGGTDPLVRLDTTDAKFVQAIHTNGDIFGLGISKSFAHVDIFPNGGNTQPGCKDLIGSIVGSIIEFIFLDFNGAIGIWACSHVRAVDFFVESFNRNCPFAAYKCGSYNDFKAGKCTTACSAEGSCTVLGYGSETNTAVRGDFYLNTDSKSSYCLQSSRFAAPVSQSQAKTNGRVTVTIRKPTGELSPKYTIVEGIVQNGQLLNSWLEVPSSVLTSAEEKPSLILRYTRLGLLPTTQPKFLSLDSITLYVLQEEASGALKLVPVTYGGITLEAGVDFIIS